MLVSAIEAHQVLLERTPRLVATAAAFCSANNEAAAKAKGVKHVCILNRSTKSRERKREWKKRWLRAARGGANSFAYSPSDVGARLASLLTRMIFSTKSIKVACCASDRGLKKRSCARSIFGRILRTSALPSGVM